MPKYFSASDPSPQRIRDRIEAIALSVDSYNKCLAVEEGHGIEDDQILRTAEKFEKWIHRPVITTRQKKDDVTQ